MTSSLLQAEYIPALKTSGLALHGIAAAWLGYSSANPLSQRLANGACKAPTAVPPARSKGNQSLQSSNQTPSKLSRREK